MKTLMRIAHGALGVCLSVSAAYWAYQQVKFVPGIMKSAWDGTDLPKPPRPKIM